MDTATTNTTMFTQFDGAESYTWIALTFTVFLNTAAMILNIFLLFLVIKSRRLQTLENSFMVHLVALDLAFTVTALGLTLFWYWQLTTPERITGCLCMMILKLRHNRAKSIAGSPCGDRGSNPAKIGRWPPEQALLKCSSCTHPAAATAF